MTHLKICVLCTSVVTLYGGFCSSLHFYSVCPVPSFNCGSPSQCQHCGPYINFIFLELLLYHKHNIACKEQWWISWRLICLKTGKHKNYVCECYMSTQKRIKVWKGKLAREHFCSMGVDTPGDCDKWELHSHTTITVTLLLYGQHCNFSYDLGF